MLATRPQGKMTSSGGEENNVCLWGRHRWFKDTSRMMQVILYFGIVSFEFYLEQIGYLNWVSCNFCPIIFFCDKYAFIFSWIFIMFIWNYDIKTAVQIMGNVFQISFLIWAASLLFYLLKLAWHNQLIYDFFTYKRSYIIH